MGDFTVTVVVGEPQDPPTLDGEVVTLADVTDTSLDLNVNDAFLTLEFRLSCESGESMAYTAWQMPTDGKLAFAGLAAGTQYIVLTRVPGDAETVPSGAVACPGGVFVTLTAVQNTEKAAFETAYDDWKADTATDPADALARYDALAGTLSDATPKDQLALDEVTALESERLAELQAAQDDRTARAWLDEYLSTMEASIADPVPVGMKEKAAQALEAYNGLSEDARALVDGTLANHQDGGESAPLPDPLTAYRNLTAAEIRDEAAATPGLEDFGETYANAVQGAANKETVDKALDRLVDTYTALAAQLPAEGWNGDPQGDMDALYGEFTAELDALRGPAVDPWLLAGGLAALFGACVAAQLLFRRKNGKHDKTGR